MNNLPLSAAFALALLLCGCAASAQQLVPLPAQDVTVTRPDLTRIYFVREDAPGLFKGGILVVDGETKIGTLNSGSFLCWERAGGRTLGRAYYEAVDPSKGVLEGIVELDCAAGQAFYFNVTVERYQGRPSVVALDPEEGRRLVAERRPAGER